MSTNVVVRAEVANDVAKVGEITRRAFAESELGHNGEAELVDRLRIACPDALSLVAETKGDVVGHILFTPATIETDNATTQGMGLAPMSVLPEFQRRGVGTALVNAGLEQLRQQGQPFVIVLGHPEYYPRFGFVRASEFDVRCEFENVPDELFLIRVFDDAMGRVIAGGIAKYRPEFHGDTT